MIELLVVVAVVLILASFLIPALNQATVAAKHAVCLSNLSQCANAFSLYQNDFAGYIPPVNQWNAGVWRTDPPPSDVPTNTMVKSNPYVSQGWPQLLANLYFGSREGAFNGVYQCPFDYEGRPYHYDDSGKRARDDSRLSYARIRADGIDGATSPAGYDDEHRLASYFWPYRQEDMRCYQEESADDDGPCFHGCRAGAPLRSPRQTVLLIESHESPLQVQHGVYASVTSGQWWSLANASPSPAEKNHPHWSHEQGGKTTVSANFLAADGHVGNFSPEVRPHARWRLARRPRGFPPSPPAHPGYPYGWMSPY